MISHDYEMDTNSLEFFLLQAFSQSVRQPNQFVLFFVWLLTMGVISMIYKSNLAAVFIKPKLKVPFESVEELLQQDEVKFRIPLGGILDSILPVSNTSDFIFTARTAYGI